MVERIKVGIVGAPGAGKSTLAHHLVTLGKMMGKSVEYAPEYARQYILRHGAPDNVFEQLAIFLGQKRLEEELLRVYDYVIADSASFLSTIYAQGDVRIAKERSALVEIYRLSLEELVTYQHILYIPPELPCLPDGIRYQSETEAKNIDLDIRRLLDRFGVSYEVVQGLPRQRLEIAAKHIHWPIEKIDASTLTAVEALLLS